MNPITENFYRSLLYTLVLLFLVIGIGFLFDRRWCVETWLLPLAVITLFLMMMVKTMVGDKDE